MITITSIIIITIIVILITSVVAFEIISYKYQMQNILIMPVLNINFNFQKKICCSSIVKENEWENESEFLSRYSIYKGFFLWIYLLYMKF